MQQSSQESRTLRRDSELAAEPTIDQQRWQVALRERHQGRRTVVLVLEDDDICRAVARNILRAGGFDVLCASNFHEAARYVECDGKIDIALVDVKMPHGMPHGISFARMAQMRRPSLKVVFMSVHLKSDDLRLIEEGEVLLCKPFAPHQLLEP